MSVLSSDSEMDNPAANHVESTGNNADDELLIGLNSSRRSPMTWFRGQVQTNWKRTYFILAGVGVFILLALAIIITLATVPRSSDIIVTTTIAPTTTTTSPSTTTTSTTPSTTTSTTTPTTTTSTTTPTTTTSTTTPTTTTSTTTPTTTTKTTTPTTTTTTTTVPTTTTVTTTQNPNTTTVPTTPPTTSPTTQPTFPSTSQPFPNDTFTKLPPISLLYNLGLNPKFDLIDCKFGHDPSPVFKYNVTIQGHVFTSPGGETKKEAKTGAAMSAVEQIFHVKYPNPIPQPHTPCIVNVDMKSSEFQTFDAINIPIISARVEPSLHTTARLAVTTEPPPFPSTSQPFPNDTFTKYPPISLLFNVGLNPKFEVVECKFGKDASVVFKYNVHIQGHTFTSPGGDTKKEAKTGAAMSAIEQIFNVKYPNPIPEPHAPCIVNLHPLYRRLRMGVDMHVTDQLNKPPMSSIEIDPTSSTEPPFHPTTNRPLPKNATDYPPVSLLYMMNVGPVFREIPCRFDSVKPTFKYVVSVMGHNYTSDGANSKHIAKQGAAMVANEELFDIKYSYPIPKPDFPCHEQVQLIEYFDDTTINSDL